jgi:hypothetical protein
VVNGMHARIRPGVAAAVAALVTAAGGAQPVAPEPDDPMPMADYLGLLEQLAPAARQGAEAYLAAHLQRCRRAMTTGELRHAMSRHGGEPVLMAMIRASQLQDAKAVAALASRISCRGTK